MVPAEVGVEVTSAGRLFEHVFEQKQRYTSPPTGRQPIRRSGDGILGAMKKAVPLVLGGLMLVTGLVWTLQGLGYLSGSPMTGVPFWALVGPIVAGFGVALMVVGYRGPR